MTGHITLPIWIFLILLVASFLMFFQYVVYPMIAAFLNARTRMITEEMNPKLQLRLSPFTLTRRHVLADRLANDPAVEAAISEMASHKGLSEEQFRRESWRMAWDIVPAFNPYFYFRIGYRMARACLRALYKITVAFEDESKMADVKTEDAVVFIINHRSNIDYAAANYLTSKRTMLSFGVGEWSRVWPIQPFFRMAGGYFVRRGSDDPHYRLLLKRYVQMATDARVPHAIFIEGRLSTDGRVGEPQVGILSYITEKFDPDTSPDLVFMPIGLNYDRVIEDVNVVRFTSDEFKNMGKIYVVRQGAQFLLHVMWELIFRRQRFGMHCSNFGNPISFKTWLEERGVDWTSLSRSERFEQIQALGHLLKERMENLVPATPVTILSRVWFDDPAARIDRSTAKENFSKIANRLLEAGCHVVLRKDSMDKSFEHALKIMRDRKMLSKNQNDEFVVRKSRVPLINYYGNSISQYL